MKKIILLISTIVFITTSVMFSAENPLKQKVKVPISSPTNAKDKQWNLINSKQVNEMFHNENYYPNVILVKLKEQKEITENKKSIRNSLLANNLQTLNVSNINLPFEQFVNEKTDKNGISRIYEIRYDSPIDIIDLCKELMQNPDVEYATPVYKRFSNVYSPNDPDYIANKQYGLFVMKLPSAWDITKGDPKVKIAIVDSAIDWTHEDLNENIWTNIYENPNNTIDDDNNGFVNDVHGWDFVGDINSNSTTLLPDNDTRSIYANNTHGTHVAGCASGVTDNGKGIASPGFNCSILPVKVGADDIYMMGIIDGYSGILYAAKMGADVINCSWGGPGYSPAEADIVKQAYDMGSVLVISAGNTSTYLDANKLYPACYPNVLVVGSTGTSKPSDFSEYGIAVDVWAPGDQIYSTVPGNQYEAMSGTSMSSPYVAGVVGLVKSIHPDWSPAKLMMQMRSTLSNIIAPTDATRPYYFGMVNAYDAVRYNYNDETKKVPGIAVRNSYLSGDNVIKNFDVHSVNLDLINYLSQATNTTITVSAYDVWVKLTNNTKNIGTIGTDGTSNMEFDVEIDENCPWFSATIRLLVEIKADNNYVNYDLIEIPLSIESDNEFGVLVDYTMPLQYARPNAFQMLDKANGWFVGNDEIYNLGYFGIIVDGKLKTANQLSSNPVYALHCFSNQSAIIGTGSTDDVSTSELLRTTDGGKKWILNNTSLVTGFINFLHFWDDNNGIFLGDPKLNTNKWGCATTTDGGHTWYQMSTLPPSFQDEDGLVGSGQFKGDEVWFGSNKGRIFYSPDRGKTWEVSVASSAGYMVTELSFIDKNIGIAVLSDGSTSTSNRFLAMTTDGKTWRNHPTLNFKSLGIYPVYVFTPENSNKQHILFSNGEIHYSEDNGVTWKYLSSKAGNFYVLGSHQIYDPFVRLWQFGESLTYLDFPYSKTSIKREVAVVEETPIDFGNVENTMEKSRFIKLIGTGNASVDVLSYEVVPNSGTTAEEFSVKSTLPLTVDVGSTSNFRIGFSPKTEGTKSANIVLTITGDPNKYSFEVKGNSTPISSVTDLSKAIFRIYPNPSSTYIEIANYPLSSNLVIYNSLGLEVFSQALPEGLSTQIDIANFSNGLYFIKIGKEIQTFIKK